MGRNSSGSSSSSGSSNGFAGIGKAPVGVTTTGKRVSKAKMKKVLAKAESISTLPDREVVKQLQRGISRFEKVMGVRERKVMVAPLNGAYGVTYIGSDGSHGIYLSKSAFSGKRKDVENAYKKANYDTGFKNKTNRAIQHTVTHELAHATWCSSYSGSKQKAAGNEIRDLYRKWMWDKKKKGYGTYGASNVDEFWAEVVTKGIHGKSDKYTRKAIRIARKYKL